MTSKKTNTTPKNPLNTKPKNQATPIKPSTAGSSLLWQQLGDFDPEHTLMLNGQPIPLGGMTVQTFLRDYWQKKPLLIRQAIPNFKAFYRPEDALSDLCHPDIESRLIIDDPEQGWSLQSGPLKKNARPKRKTPKWTALIQGVDLLHPLGHALINLFRFIPDVRLDDLMVSFATDGGGVGPHFDAYDVFLLQGYGKRHWRISQQQDCSIKPNLPLKILQNFQPEQDWILEPGDMLYLPPKCAHDGIAIGECMTYSIGFRSPSYQELGVALLQFVEDNLTLEGHYADPKLKFQNTPAHIPNAMIATISDQLERMRWDKEWITESIGCYLSEPKPSVFFDLPASCSEVQFKKRALKHGLRLAFATRMLYHEPWIFINGEHFVADGQEALILQQLANQKYLDVDALESTQHTSPLWSVWHDWYEQGWLVFCNTTS